MERAKLRISAGATSLSTRAGLIAVLTISAWAATARAQRPLGIDVSYWQGSLSQTTWNNVAGAGRTFAFIRCTHYSGAGETNAHGTPDTTFPTNMDRARNAGLLVGAYHFARPTIRSPQTEATFFLTYATQHWGKNYISSGYLRPVLDIEEGGGSTPVGAANLSAWSNAWMDAVEAQTGVEPIIYCNSNYASNYLNSSLASRTLWVANYSCSINPQTANPPAGIGIWSAWTFWQYCSSLSVGGISPVDTNVFNGTAAQLLTHVIGGAIAPPVISNVQVGGITDGSATVTWTTDVTADSRVEYGTTTGYGLTASDSALVTSHALNLTGLAPSTLYHYRVRSVNAAGTTYSGDYTFSTASFSGEVIVDNLDPGFTYVVPSSPSNWNTGTASSRYGSNYFWCSEASGTSEASATHKAQWTPSLPVAGTWDVYIWYATGSNRSTNTYWKIVNAGPTRDLRVNEQTGGNGWTLLALDVPFSQGTAGNVQMWNNTGITGTSRVVQGDAVRFVYKGGDSNPPSIPGNIIATATSTTAIQLNWSPSTDDFIVSGYNIYRDGAYLTSTASTSLLDSGGSPNTAYSYRVSAYDSAQNESTQSAAVSRATLSVPPTTGSITRSTATVCAGANIAWSAAGGFGPGKVQYYRYAWHQNPTHSFSGAEPQWSGGTLMTTITASGTWYLHVRGFNSEHIANGTSSYVVSAGAHIAADFDGDCDVDRSDVTAFEACLSGAGIPLTPGCETRDLDIDGDIDLSDFGTVQRCSSGGGIPADPNCGS